MNSLGLKWGTLKSWSFDEASIETAQPLFEEYSKLGSCMSAIAQRDTPRQKEIICELIDLVDDPRGVFLDWDGEYVTREKSKEYVMNYVRKE